MLNLLPPEQKQEILEEEKFKLILILETVVLAALLSFVLVLFIVRTSILADLEVEKIYSQQKEKELNSLGIKKAEENIKSSNFIFSSLDAFYEKQINLAGLAEKIFKALPGGSYLFTMNFNPASSRVFLSGFSLTRDDLLTFRKNLEAESSFGEINFPPENWVQKTGVNFNVGFKIK